MNDVPVFSSSVVDGLRLSLAELKRLDRSRARTMPPAYYTSPEFLEFEKETIFRKEWICLGHAGEIPNAGDYFTTELIDEQLLVARGEDGVVRVLSNVCRHRANIVAEGSGNRKRFTCAYHAWTYGSDGKLISAPLMEKAPAFKKENCGLPVLNSTVWNNFIFVNLDGQAAPLQPQLASLDAMLTNYHVSERHHVYVVEDVWGTNWKCLTENFMEGYHLSATHLKTLHAITPTSLCEKIPGDGAYTAYRSHFNPNYPDRGPFHDDLTLEEKRSSLLFCVFPSFVVSIAPHFTLYVCLRPLGADRVALRWGLAGHVEGPDQPEVKNYIELCNAFNAEDKEKLEMLQKAMKTRYYESGPLAPDNYEGTIWDFYQFMASRVAAESGATLA